MRSDASTQQRGIICSEEDAMLPNGDHARLVYSVIRGASPDAAAPEHVRRSWQRCVEEYGLDPESKVQPVLVSHQELLVRKEQNLELVSLADAEMAHLYRQLAGSGHSIILTDRDGVLLSYRGDPSFRGAASRTGLAPGAVWSERYGGTNGMGTWSEGIIALDPAGAIAAADRNALFQLGCKKDDELVGAPLERVFNISLAALLGRSRRKSFHPLPLYEARHGGRFFAVAQEPE